MSLDLGALQTRAQTILAAVDDLAEVTVLEVSDGTIEDRLTQALGSAGLTEAAGKLPGLVLIVSVLTGRAVSVNQPKLRLKASVVVAVLENPLINRVADQGTEIPALDAVGIVISALHFQPVVAGNSALQTGPRRFELAPDPAFELLTNDQKRTLYGVGGGVGYHVHFSAEAR